MPDLISPAAAADGALGECAWLDCRFRLEQPDWGASAWRAGHVPGARYAHLDHDLADLHRTGEGRHPLPTRAAFVRRLSAWGLRRDQAVVVYDDVGGAIAARAWWLLRHAGHEQAVLLDGGFQAWAAAGLPVSRTEPELRHTDEVWGWGRMPALDTPALESNRSRLLLVDARARPRFRGLEEPLDRVAGHVPGAINRPFAENLSDDGRFKDPEVLREEWSALLQGQAPERVAHMCGSGVTACHNLLAMRLAALGTGLLYWPSWSGWIADGRRPVAGEAPDSLL